MYIFTNILTVGKYYVDLPGCFLFALEAKVAAM